jgi:GNAT superfamily N-acetyltransferase
MTPREMTASDRRFVVPTWALSSRYDGFSKPARFRLVDRVLDARARCIVLAEDATVHAWACGSEDALHYVYVPPELRGHGIAAKLIALVLGSYAERINVTHPWPRASSRFRYTPHLLHREREAA